MLIKKNQLNQYYNNNKLWKWRKLNPFKLASKGDGSLLIVPEFLDKLEKLQNMHQDNLIITSAYRDPIYNAKIGGAVNSYHKKGMAVDILCNNNQRQKLLYYAKESGFTGFGIYKNFIHLDIGLSRFWYG